MYNVNIFLFSIIDVDACGELLCFVLNVVKRIPNLINSVVNVEKI